MSQKLKYPQWQEPLKAAILEFDIPQLPGKVQKAEEVIADRIQELSFDQGNEEERRALSDGLSIIRSLKQGRLKP
jgi:hypothetical protein